MTLPPPPPPGSKVTQDVDRRASESQPQRGGCHMQGKVSAEARIRFQKKEKLVLWHQMQESLLTVASL